MWILQRVFGEIFLFGAYSTLETPFPTRERVRPAVNSIQLFVIALQAPYANDF